MKPSTSSTAIGSLKPASPSSVRSSRRRSPAPRSSENTAAPSVEATIDAQQQALERREVEQPRRGEARDGGGDQRADHRQADRGPQHRPDLAPAGGQAALEQDQRERDDADRLGELEVGEVDPAEPVGADEHADAEEQHEAGQPQAPRHQGRGERRREQRSGDEDGCTVVQARSMSTSRPARSPGTRLPGLGREAGYAGVGSAGSSVATPTPSPANSMLRTGPVNECRALTSHQMPTARISPPTVSGA